MSIKLTFQTLRCRLNHLFLTPPAWFPNDQEFIESQTIINPFSDYKNLSSFSGFYYIPKSSVLRKYKKIPNYKVDDSFRVEKVDGDSIRADIAIYISEEDPSFTFENPYNLTDEQNMRVDQFIDIEFDQIFEKAYADKNDIIEDYENYVTYVYREFTEIAVETQEPIEKLNAIQKFIDAQEDYLIFDLHIFDQILILFYTLSTGNSFLNHPMRKDIEWSWEEFAQIHKKSVNEAYIILVWLSILDGYIEGSASQDFKDFEREEKKIQERLRVLSADEWKQIHKCYVDNLERIINNAPPVPIDYIVYRGETTEFKKQPGYEDLITTGFTSTSLSFSKAHEFLRNVPKTHSKVGDKKIVDENPTCCLKIFNLKKGTPCLFIGNASFYNEKEILLPPNLHTELVFNEIKKFTLNYEDTVNNYTIETAAFDV